MANGSSCKSRTTRLCLGLMSEIFMHMLSTECQKHELGVKFNLHLAVGLTRVHDRHVTDS
jgi:hypothetical protein